MNSEVDTHRKGISNTVRETIINRKNVLLGENFLGKMFYNNSLLETLTDVNDAKNRSLFMDELIQLRINSPIASPFWTETISTSSLQLTGQTKNGKKVVVYAHTPNYLCEVENLKNSIDNKVFAPCSMIEYDKKKFQKLLDLEDNKTVFVLDYSKDSDTFRNMSISKALKNPHVMGFMGGKENAEKYLKKYGVNFNNRIDLYFDDYTDKYSLARMLIIDDAKRGSCLYGSTRGFDGCMIGVPKNTANPLELLDKKFSY